MTAHRARRLDWLVRQPIAHRGLHDGNVETPENSLPAARAAMAAGFAIECDVMLSKDGVPVVFHDATLDRLTLASGRVCDWSLDELRTLALCDSRAQIPTVQEFLNTIDGAVPVVMEMKGRSPEEDGGFVERLEAILAGYNGLLVLMSFDAWLIDQAVGANARPVGLTAEGQSPAEIEAHRAIYERGCSFTSYHVHDVPNAFTDWVRSEKGDPVITWTVRTPAEVETSMTHADQMTFEGFLPRI